MTSKDRLCVRGLNPDVIEEFRKYVINKYGKAHTVFGQTVELALIEYLNNHIEGINHTHAHTQQQEEEKQSQKKKRDLPMSPYHARLTTIQEKMKTVGAWDVESFQDGIAIRYIKEVCGGDPRTIQKYYSDLETKWSIEH